MSQRTFDSPPEIAGVLRALVGIHRPSGGVRIFWGIVGGAWSATFLMGAVYFAMDGARHGSWEREWAVAAFCLACAVFLVWDLWVIFHMRYEFTERAISFSWSPGKLRWSVPIESVSSIRRVPSRSGEDLEIRLRTGGRRWLSSTRSMREALAASFSQP